MGSYLFYAPEMFMRDQDGVEIHGELTDIWALGVSFYYLLCGRYPWEEAKNPMHLKELILLTDIDFDLIKNESARYLIKQLLTKNPAKRISLEDILNSPWVTKNGKDSVKLNEVTNWGNGDLGNINRALQIKQMGL